MPPLPPVLNDLFAELNTPDKVQEYVDTKIQYNSEREDRSVLQVAIDHLAECYNGALFAAACLRSAGYRVFLMQLWARGGDEEHVLCVYEANGRLGAVAQSKFMGLKSRQPIYLSAHDLAVSYMEFYFGFDGRYTLLSHTDLLDLATYGDGWLTEPGLVARIAKDLSVLPTHALVELADPFYSVSPQRYWAEVQYLPPGTEVPEEYRRARPKPMKNLPSGG